MNPELINSSKGCNIIAIPYPGRGHINPLMNFCKLMVLTRPDAAIKITFIVTEEWRSLLSSETLPENIQFATIPNVIPSEKARAENMAAFGFAVFTKIEPEVERLLDRIEVPEPRMIVSDSYLTWTLRIGKRRNIPVASFWTTSVSLFELWYQLLDRREYPQKNVSEQGEELVDDMLADLPKSLRDKFQEVVNFTVEIVSSIRREAKHLIFPSFYELESKAINNLKTKFPLPIYCVGPAIPYFKGEEVSGQITSPKGDGQNYFEWLNAQPRRSVLYISQGSFLSVSSQQLDEIVAGVLESGVRFLWVVRQDAISLPQGGGSKGLAVPWCDQLKVLCHPSIGGFWSHCGWNSTKEAVYAGVPVLTFPVMWDQAPNSKKIVEDWKIGWRVRREHDDSLVTRAEISATLTRFMDLEHDEGKEMRTRAQQLREACLRSISEGGSSDLAIKDFVRKISE